MFKFLYGVLYVIHVIEDSSQRLQPQEFAIRMCIRVRLQKQSQVKTNRRRIPILLVNFHQDIPDIFTGSCSILYLRAELNQQLGSIGAVGGQAADCCAEVGQAGDGFAGLGGATGTLALAS